MINLETSRFSGRFPSLTGTYGDAFRLEDEEADATEGGTERFDATVTDDMESDFSPGLGPMTTDSCLGIEGPWRRGATGFGEDVIVSYKYLVFHYHHKLLIRSPFLTGSWSVILSNAPETANVTKPII